MRFGIGLLVTLGLAFVAFWLGAWVFGFRVQHQHEQRLRNMLKANPTVHQVVEGLGNEAAPQVAAPADSAALLKAATEYGGAKAAEILAKGRRWPRVRFFRAGDLVYVIYFDETDHMSDYTFVSR